MAYKYKISVGGYGGTFFIGSIKKEVITWWKDNHSDTFKEYLSSGDDERIEILENMFEGDEDKIDEFDSGPYQLEENYSDIVGISTVKVIGDSYFQIEKINDDGSSENFQKEYFDKIRITNNIINDYKNHPYNKDNKINIDLNLVTIDDDHLNLIANPPTDETIIYHFEEIRGTFDCEPHGDEGDNSFLVTETPFDVSKIDGIEIMWIEDEYFLKSFTYENKKFFSDNMPEGEHKGSSITVDEFFD
jgi:hypothetical protein